jgi:hypothetical protein
MRCAVPGSLADLDDFRHNAGMRADIEQGFIRLFRFSVFVLVFIFVFTRREITERWCASVYITVFTCSLLYFHVCI